MPLSICYTYTTGDTIRNGAYLSSDNVAHSCAEPGQDSERASLPYNGKQVHILAQAWIQVLCFSYGVPDKSAIRLLLSEEE